MNTPTKRNIWRRIVDALALAASKTKATAKGVLGGPGPYRPK
jgi:hypothetical protein